MSFSLPLYEGVSPSARLLNNCLGQFLNSLSVKGSAAVNINIHPVSWLAFLRSYRAVLLDMNAHGGFIKVFCEYEWFFFFLELVENDSYAFALKLSHHSFMNKDSVWS